jgi:Flp pilus assembly protein TadB
VAALMAIGIVLVGTTVWLVVRALVLPRLRLEAHLRHVDSYGFGRPLSDDRGLVAVQRGWFNAWANATAERVGRWLLAHVPRLRALTRADLSAAGYYEITPDAVHGYRAMSAGFLVALVILYALATGGFSAIGILLTACVAVAGWELPATAIRERGRSRLNVIDRELPQFLDLVVATVEAGVAFGGALNSVANRFKGPLGDELRLTMHQQNLGISTERALNDMAERLQIPSVRAFTRAVIRAESHGISIGPVLRSLALEIRQRRRDAARERIQKAPVKMLFPLVFFILLPLLMVILFPAMYNILHVLTHT